MNENGKVRKTGAQAIEIEPEALEAAAVAWWDELNAGSVYQSWQYLSRDPDWAARRRRALGAAVLAYIEAERSGSVARWFRITRRISAEFEADLERLEALSSRTIEFAAELEALEAGEGGE